jgi:hypothetical protein
VLAKLSRAGLITRRVSTKGFQVASYISSPFPKLILTQLAFWQEVLATWRVHYYYKHMSTHDLRYFHIFQKYLKMTRFVPLPFWQTHEKERLFSRFFETSPGRDR